jgi:hypothetical protein
MSCGEAIPTVSTHLVAYSTTPTVVWLVPWMSAVGLDKIRAALRAKNAGGSLEWQLCWQTAAVRVDAPGAMALLDVKQTGGVDRATGELSLSTGSVMYARFGVSINLAAGVSTPNEADFSLDLSYVSCGQVVATYADTFTSSSTGGHIVPVGGWIPAIAVSKVRMAWLINSSTGNAEARLVFRKASTTKEAPTSGDTTIDTWHGAGESNTGDLVPTLGADMGPGVGRPRG